MPARTEQELLEDQLSAIAAFHAAARAEPCTAPLGTSREVRADLRHRLEVRRREHAALVARAAYHLEQSAYVVCPAPRALLVHRNPWLRAAIGDRLHELGVDVVGEFEDGADATGALVVEQPDLLLVQDRLPSLSGLEVLQRSARFAPHTRCGALLEGTRDAEPYRRAGARVLFTERPRPAEVADALTGCLVTAS